MYECQWIENGSEKQKLRETLFAIFWMKTGFSEDTEAIH